MKFSLSMCVWNGDNAQHFEDTIRSVLNSTRCPDEIILVVDGPVNKDIQDVINKYSEGLSVIYLEKNSGHAIARNTSINAAKYDIVALMDADDLCEAERFEKQLTYMEENEDVAVVSGQVVEFVDSPENIVARRPVPLTHETIVKKIKYTNPFSNTCVMMRKSMVMEVGGYESEYFPEDWFLFIKMYRQGCKFANLSDVIGKVRYTTMQTRRSGWKYFRSVSKIYGFLYCKKIINIFEFLFFINVRFFVQVVFTQGMREKFYKIFLRKKA